MGISLVDNNDGRWPSLLAATALAIAGCTGSAPANIPTTRPADATFALDLDKDGCGDILQVYENKQTQMGVLHAELCAGSIGSAATPLMPMWFAEPAYFDGPNTAPYVVVGTLSDQYRHDEPDPHRTVHVWNIVNRRWNAVWRGSALARPLIDVAIGSTDSRNVLVARGIGGITTTYEWTGFGFHAMGGERPAP